MPAKENEKKMVDGGERELDLARYRVATLGERTIASPLNLCTTDDDEAPGYVPDGMRVLHSVEVAGDASVDSSVLAYAMAHTLEKAGPRELIYFDPKKTRAAIVTSGGLCPGINSVIRSIVLELVHKYGVSSVIGFRFGFAGLDPAAGVPPPIALGPNEVRHIHTLGGTMLGTSRGAHPPKVMVDTLVSHGINLVFAIGGDGTMAGAHAIAEEIGRRRQGRAAASQDKGLDMSVVAIPKTIDNDIAFVDKTFGFETAVSIARVAIDAAHTEAHSALGGIGLVKLMGREAGFIAAHATIASHDVNVCLVPEVRFRLEGPTGLLAHIERRLAERGHAVIVVAEGCGKDLAVHDLVPGAVGAGVTTTTSTTSGPEHEAPRDASGNLVYGSVELDIGLHLKKRISDHLLAKKIPHALKYIDPSYMIRSVPANAIDSIFCDELARDAVHAAMAGKTDLMIGRLHRSFIHVPLDLVLSEKKRINPKKELWLAVMETTGQPRFV